MRIGSVAKYAGVAAVVALFAGCSSDGYPSFAPRGVAPSGQESGLTPLSVRRELALTMPHYRAGYVRTDRRKSWMLLPDKKARAPLFYVDDDGTQDTYVFSGFPKKPKLVGTLSGFDYPYGECVDKKGDVYITNFDNGTLDEYAYGGTKPLNTFTDSGGYLIGCSVNAGGDVAVTAFETSSGYGNVCIWKGGKGSPSCVDGSSSANCYYLWTFGWDNKNNLIGEGEYSGISACAIFAGKTSMTKLQISGFTIDFAGGTEWDGKYIALTDQELGGKEQSGIQDVKLSGSTLTAVGSPIVLTDSCYSDYVDDVNPFFSGGGKNILNDTKKQASAVDGANLWCYDEGKPEVAQWPYPAGGPPEYRLTSGLTEPYGAALDIK